MNDKEISDSPFEFSVFVALLIVGMLIVALISDCLGGF